MSEKKNKNIIYLKDKIETSDNLFELINKLVLANYSQLYDVINVIVKLLHEKDAYTKGHSIRVSYYSLLIGQELNLEKHELITLQLAALLHDIGKIGVSDRVLKKPGRLTDSEFDEMKEHPGKAVKILRDIDCLKDLVPYIKSHHERYDGKGYPGNLKGEEIPLFSRIILVADTADAMMSTRPYRKGLSMEDTIDELFRCSGTQFDPRLVEIFVKVIKKNSKQKKAS